ncbi:hypothetical protein BJF78_10850 [Pseudonocardia sp. CNS-139]|nr:hypothetical protein BJF78_10850 [Pseudonocardia sp. CNS-139]
MDMDLPYPAHAGCAGRRAGAPRGERPHPCTAAPVGTVTYRVEEPRPHTERLFVCEAHAVGQFDPRPLTPDDRAELRRRRERVENSPRVPGGDA